MKKIILAFCLLLIAGLAALYYFIPETLVISEAVSINCNREGAFRKLAGFDDWTTSLAGNTGIAPGIFTISKKLTSGFDIRIKQTDSSLNSKMTLIAYGKDTTLLSWQCVLSSGNNPFRRIADYRRAVSVKRNMDTLCSHLKTYLSDFENVYGFRIEEASTRDTMLIATKSTSAVYPSTDYIYMLAGKLKNFCLQQGCSATGPPMLNITPLDTGNFQVMVAMPVNRAMTAVGDVTPKRMVPGKFIITEVTGGVQTVEQTLQQMRYYFQDYARMAMAIPFSYLVTDRQKETDTTKWITRIYIPVY